MAAKPETSFSNALRDALPEGIYSMKNNNDYTSGVPDLWFSGPKADLWVEMKFVQKLPKTVPLRPYDLLSKLQEKWLRDRYEEGRNVAVIIGCKRSTRLEGFILTDLMWEKDIPTQDFNALIVSKSELVSFIKEQVM